MDTRRVTLLLRPARDHGDGTPPSVEGELEYDDGTVRAFIGWLGLVNELERVVAELRPG